MSATADLNDYSSRVNITGVTIASIPIDIVAQTIGNITIDIAAASMGPIAISINVVNIVGNIPIDIIAQTIGNITIDIAAASMGSIAVSINVADIVGNLPIDIVAQTVGNISIDIAAQTVGNIGIDIAANSFGNLPIDIVAQTIGNIGISLNANTAGNITVDIAAQTMVGNLSIDIAANSFGNLPIDIVAQTIGNIGINLAANTLGNLTIDIAAQTLGNIAIDVAAQTVDLNIKTSGGVNIIIDQLEQGAYLERRSILSNDNGITAPSDPPTFTNSAYRGKYFPRGCRGHIPDAWLYCKAATGGTITLSFAPIIGMGAIFSVTITPGAAWDWVKPASVRRVWNYDSMFVWVSALTGDAYYAYDTVAPYDFHRSDDSGVTWYANDVRVFLRVSLTGETVGDIPVSGTLNTIEIPAQSTERLYTVRNALPDAETTIKTIEGAGTVEYIQLEVEACLKCESTSFRIYCDGNLAWYWSFKSMNSRGYAADTPGMSLIQYAADGECDVHLTLKFAFKRQLKITASADGHVVGGEIPNVHVEGLINLMR